jgi:adenylate cyclase
MRKLQHDLRTPLGQILGYGEMLQEELQDRALTELLPDLQRICAAATTVLGLVDGIFRPEGVGESATTSSTNAVQRDAPHSGNRTGRLLIVDDESSNRELLRRWLARSGYEVSEASGGRAALQMIEDQTFDLVLLDVMMPDIDGIETLEAIRRTRSVSELPVIMATALAGSDDTVSALERGANDYVTKPFDHGVVAARIHTQLALRAAAHEIETLAQQLELRNSFLRQTFGRYLSDEVVSNLLERDEGLEIRGERRRVTILLADLRGFTALTESLGPTEIVSILNTYLGTMSDVIHDYQGTVDEFLGDAILAHFGALTTRDDDTERAVACAIAMQRAIEDVNSVNGNRGHPQVAMGIGIATGDVIVGNVGSEKRSKHTAIGSAVNLASRIEGYTLGGEILISQATVDDVADLVRVDRVREVWPKGYDAPVSVHRVAAIGGRYEMAVPQDRAELVELAEKIGIRFTVLEGKSVSGIFFEGYVSALSSTGARIHTDADVGELADLRIELADDDGADVAFYGKVVDRGTDDATVLTVRFSARSLALDTSVPRSEPALTHRAERELSHDAKAR